MTPGGAVPSAGTGPSGPSGPSSVPGPGGRRLALAAMAAWAVAAVAAVTVIVAQGRGQSSAGPGASPPGAGHGQTSQSARLARTMVTITDVGNMNFGASGKYPPGGPGPLLAGVTRHLRSQLTVATLQTTLGTGGATKCAAGTVGCYAFQAPPGYAVAVHRAGFAALNLAGSHADDAGRLGLRQTNAALRAAHLRYTGRPQQTAYLVRRHVRIALLGFAPYQYTRDQLALRAAIGAVRKAAARSDVLIVFMHANGEGVGTRSDDPITFAHAMIRAGADLVLGSGPHALRGMQWYHGRLIAYSMGNFAGYYTLGLSGPGSQSAILRLRLRGNGLFVGGRVTALRLTGPGIPAVDPTRAGIRLLNSLSRAEFGASAVRITPTGRILAPPGSRARSRPKSRPRRK